MRMLSMSIVHVFLFSSCCFGIGEADATDSDTSAAYIEAEQVVKEVYALILERAPKQEGLDHHAKILVTQHKDRAWLIDSLKNSGEFQRLKQKRRDEHWYNISLAATSLIFVGTFLFLWWLEGHNTSYKPFIYGALCLIPVLLYYWGVVKLSCNVPIGDDYDTALAYLSLDQPTRLRLLFAQHNEHRLALFRAILESIYYVSGRLDLRSAILISNAFLAGILLLFIRILKEHDVPLKWLVPASWFLFNWQADKNMIWATSAAGFFPLLFFGLLALYWVNKNNWAFLPLSCLAAIMATYSMGAGVSIWICMILLETSKFLRRNHTHSPCHILTRSAILIIISIVMFCCYFYGYHSPPHHPNILVVLGYPLNILRYLIALTGSAFSPFNLAHVYATTLVSLMVFFLLKKEYSRNPVLFFFALYLFAIILSASLSRSGFGEGQAYSPRYRTIPTMLTTCIALMVLVHFRKTLGGRTSFVIITACSIYISTCSVYDSYYKLKQDHQINVTDIRRWPKDVSGLNYPDTQRANEILCKAIEKGIYHLPEK